MPFVFKPRWKKEAQLLLKGSQKFLHYKRDLLEPEKIREIQSRRTDLKNAIQSKDLDAVTETSRQLRKVCEKSLTHYRSPNWLEENIEVLWVAIVVALGVRSYFVQPFRIPTGSMQPTLNGIIMTSKADDPDWEKPWFGQRLWDYVWAGKSYSDVVAERDLTIAKIEDASFFLFSRSRITFTDGSSELISAPPGAVQRIKTVNDAFLQRDGRIYLKRGPHFEAGKPIFKGTRTTGDLVLVNKFAYHFRRPERGESFVFDTNGIDTNLSGMPDQEGGTHFIKRLVGLPGDTLRIEAPKLYVNGEEAKEEMIQRVASQEDGYPGYYNMSAFANPAHRTHLREMEDPNYHEYFALGDNSSDSLDSRYWGTVKQYNLVGPALFSLWPFGSGHWGFIK